MKKNRIISLLALLTVVFVTSCSKFEPLNEKHCADYLSDSEEVEVSAIMLDDNTENPNITDPDHDEDHDKDDSNNDSKED